MKEENKLGQPQVKQAYDDEEVNTQTSKMLNWTNLAQNHAQWNKRISEADPK